MSAFNRTSFFNTGVPFVGDQGRTRREPRGRLVAVVTSPGSGGAGAAYYMRGWDSGGGGRWVVWGPYNSVVTSPTSAQTTPNFTGTLSEIHIVSGP